MAIVKIGVMSDPSAEGDYTRLIAHLNAFARQVSGNQFILTQTAGTGLPALALGAYIQHGGVVYQVQTADEAISGTPADGTYYIKVAASGEVLVATWITDISGYTWNAIYNCLTAVDEPQLLPYMVVVSGTATVYTKYRLEVFDMAHSAIKCSTITASGAISGATIDTGYGAFEIGQNLRTTDNVIFESVKINDAQLVGISFTTANTQGEVYTGITNLIGTGAKTYSSLGMYDSKVCFIVLVSATFVRVFFLSSAGAATSATFNSGNATNIDYDLDLLINRGGI
jgi:hypothetical protein